MDRITASACRPRIAEAVALHSSGTTLEIKISVDGVV